MPEQTVANHRPADPLSRIDQEEVYNLIRRGLAVALILETDSNGDRVHQDAAGAIVAALDRAKRIMECGSEKAVAEQELANHA